jgi:hypothetical protein
MDEEIEVIGFDVEEQTNQKEQKFFDRTISFRNKED